MSGFNPIGEWREVKGFPGYRVDEAGQVWSCWMHGSPIGRRMGNTWKRHKTREEKKKFGLKFDKDKRVYATLRDEKGLHKIRLHVVVAEAFLGPRPAGMVICHNDGNCENNHVSNLRYDTRKNNQLDMWKHGTMPSGERQGGSKMTWEVVYAMRRKKRKGWNYKQLCEEFGFCVMAVTRAVRGQTWTMEAEEMAMRNGRVLEGRQPPVSKEEIRRFRSYGPGKVSRRA